MLIIFLSLLPCILWLIFFYLQDRYSREPLSLVAITFLLGIFSTVPALVLNSTAGLAVALLFGGDTLAQIVLFFGTVGPIEEGVKMLAVLIFAYRQPQFKEPVDGIVYSAAAALGFAAAENVFYVSHAKSIQILALRGPLANAGHALFAALWGLALSRAKATTNLGSQRYTIIIWGWLAAAFVHGLYDFILTIMGEQSPIVTMTPIIILMLGMFSYVEYKIISFIKNSPHRPDSNNLRAVMRCPHCGELGKAKMICRKCRQRLPELDMGELRLCHQCQTVNTAGAVTCTNCRASLLFLGDGKYGSIHPHLVTVNEQGEEMIAFVLDKESITIGKTLDNDYVIDDQLIDKKHARIVWHPQGVHILQDLGSVNGSFINGLRIQEGYLQNGYEIRLGQTRLFYRAIPRM